jgi:hypothetical protein
MFCGTLWDGNEERFNISPGTDTTFTIGKIVNIGCDATNKMQSAGL